MKKSILLCIILFFAAGFGIFPFFSPGIPITHDGVDHTARIANFYQSLTDGNIVPRWAGNLNWGYGHPILMFLYPLPSYVASFFHSLGFSFIDSVKIIFVLGFLGSGLTMFLWAQSFLSLESGIVAAFLYMFASYRFVDLYVRGALGEHVAFVFAPLVLYFSQKLVKNNTLSILVFGSFSLAFLILSHNAISLMFFPFIVIYMTLLILHSKKKQQIIQSFVILLVLGLGLSAFFWVPAYFEGKYTHRDILTYGRYRESFSSFSRFISSPWSFEGIGKLSVEVGKVQWFVVFLGFGAIRYLFKNKKNFLGRVLIICLITFWLTIFFMTSSSDFIWEKITVLQKFQFTWRLLTLSVFSASICGAIITQLIPKKIKKLFIATLVVLLLIFNKDYIRANGYISKPDSFFSGIYFGTTDTGESSPIWSVSYMKEIPDAHLAVIGGESKVIELKRLSTRHVYKVSAKTKTQLRENTLYFPGWNILVDNKKVPIEYQARNNMGVMTFFLPKGEHTVIVQFTETKLRIVADSISGLTFLVVVIFIMKRFLSCIYRK